jgi:hypothetical protein
MPGLLCVEVKALKRDPMRELGPRPTLGDLQRTTPWVWLWCERCQHHATTRLRCGRHPVGTGCLKRQTTCWGALHRLREQRRYPPASRLGRQSSRLPAIPDQHCARPIQSNNTLNPGRHHSIILSKDMMGLEIEVMVVNRTPIELASAQFDELPTRREMHRVALDEI